jgi:hypothetical protein
MTGLALSKETFEHYYDHSGGNLRNFIAAGRNLAGLRNKIVADVLSAPCKTVDAILSDYNTSRGAALDRLQRTYVIDRNDPAHYDNMGQWRKVVDSSAARKQLSFRLKLKSIKSSLRVAETSGVAAWHGWIFEEYVHKMASLHRGVIRMYPYAVADRRSSSQVVEVRLNEVTDFQCVGDNFTSCIEYLQRKSAPGLYWCPDYAQYPALDAVLFLPSTKTVLYIQTTIGGKHTLNNTHIQQTHGELVKSVDFLRETKDGREAWTFAYAVLVPSQEKVERFKNKTFVGDVISELRGKAYVGYID